jgi:hypothetical protein
MLRDTTLWWRRLLHILDGINWVGPGFGKEAEGEILEEKYQKAWYASLERDDAIVLAMLQGKEPPSSCS